MYMVTDTMTSNSQAALHNFITNASSTVSSTYAWACVKQFSRVLYSKTFGGAGFSKEFMHSHGLTEYSDLDQERSSERAFAILERRGQGICTSAPYVSQDIEPCQRLNLQKPREQIRTQRFRERAQSEANGDKSYKADLHQCL